MRKFWLLRPVEGLLDTHEKREVSLWRETYDLAYGYVVCAETESQARQMAFDERPNKDNAPAWLDNSMTDCIELTVDYPSGIVLEDYLSA